MPPPFLDIMTSSSSANSGKWFNKYDALLAKAHDARIRRAQPALSAGRKR